MKLLDRYVAGEVLGTSVFAVAILSVVLVLGKVFRDMLDLLVNHNAPLEFIFTFVAYILPFSLTFTIPWAFLTAVLLVFGKMSAENELIALRSSGISIPRICAPVFVLAAAFVGICLWINLEVAPRAQVKMKNAVYNIATSNPMAMFSSDKVIDEFPGRKIYVERNNGPELHNLLVYELGEEFDPMKVVFARRGVLETDHAHNQILLHLLDARFEQRDDGEPQNLLKIKQGITAQETTFPISLRELYERNRKRSGFSAMTVAQLQEKIQEETTRKLSSEDSKKLREQKLSARVEVSKRFSFAMASFAFGLIGVPLAVTAQRKETSIGFMLSLAVALVYFLCIIFADTVRNKPHLHPEILVWSPNILFVGLGLWLFWRLSRR
jgi:lipopolysaccharide export system permease protein